MALLKFLRRPGSATDTAPAGAGSAAQAVQAARRRARHRLVGAVVLLGIGIIGFPLVFQTHPRPIPVDIPIEIPNRDKVGALKAGSAAPDTPLAAPHVLDEAPPLEPLKAAPLEPGTVPGARQVVPSSAPRVVPSEPVAAAEATVEVELPPQGRFVVQVGSFTDPEAVRDVRNKLERMGLKTYTQAAVIDGVTRVRVRVGPFNSKQEAQDVQNKVKSAGVAATLLQL